MFLKFLLETLSLQLPRIFDYDVLLLLLDIGLLDRLVEVFAYFLASLLALDCVFEEYLEEIANLFALLTFIYFGLSSFITTFFFILSDLSALRLDLICMNYYRFLEDLMSRSSGLESFPTDPSLSLLV